MTTNPTFIIIDLFCGAGGFTEGAEQSGTALVIAGINHDAKAIESHTANHPETIHFVEDIRTIRMKPLVDIAKAARQQYPHAKLLLHASLECTNFSKAKGGQPRDADSRTLAEHMYRYVKALKPDYITIENVVEFMSWGPLDENGKPVDRKQGRDYMRWRETMCSFGYRDEWRELNSANFGAYTSRNRLFGCFAKPQLPIAWPVPTHHKTPKAGSPLFSQPAGERWKPVREVLNLDDKGNSIFIRDKSLSEKTLERIEAGLIKFVAGGKERHAAFMLKYNSTGTNGSVQHSSASIEQPSHTIDTQGRKQVVQCQFLSKYNSGHPESKNITTEGPAGTVTVIDHHALVDADFLVNYQHSSKCNSLDESSPTITTHDKYAVTQPEFLQVYHGNGNNVHSVDGVAPTIPTHDSAAVVQPQFISRQFTSGTQNQSIEEPGGSLLSTPKMDLVSSEFITTTNFNGVQRGIDEPAATITADRHHHYLMNPQYSNAGCDINKPCFTIIARMDKMPPYLVETESGHIAIEVYDTDSAVTKRIKQFMAAYGIVDIKMRMLRIPELLRIQGFPATYKLRGTQADQKKFIGNAVEVTTAKAFITALANGCSNINTLTR